MKKTFRLIAALAAVSVAFAACKKDNGGKTGEDEGGGEQEAAIVIDGKFDDWGKVKLLADLKPITLGWAQTDGQRVDFLKSLKVAADGVYIYIYAEVDRSKDDGGGTSWDGKPLTPDYAGPLDIYIDTDANETTGGIYWVWEPFGWEYLFESATAFNETPGDLKDGILFEFTGENQTDIWAVDPPAYQDVTKPGFALGKGVMGSDKVIKYELSLVRALMPKIKGDKIILGVLVQSNNWKLVGALPAPEQKTESLTKSAGVTITLPKAE